MWPASSNSPSKLKQYCTYQVAPAATQCMSRSSGRLRLAIALLAQIFFTRDNRRSSLKMASIRVRCIRRPVQRVPGSEATRTSIKYIGMYKQHINIVFPGGKTNSVRRKRPDQNCPARCNCILWTRQGATEELVDVSTGATPANNTAHAAGASMPWPPVIR